MSTFNILYCYKVISTYLFYSSLLLLLVHYKLIVLLTFLAVSSFCFYGTDTPQVQETVFEELFADFGRMRILEIAGRFGRNDPLTVNDARRIIACLRQSRVDTLRLEYYDIHDDAMLNVLRDNLPLCTSVTTVILRLDNLGNEELDQLRSAFYNTSITSLTIGGNGVHGQRGSEVIRNLLVGNDTLRELIWSYNNIHPEVATGLGQGLAGNNGLQTLRLRGCRIDNYFLANLAGNSSLQTLRLRGCRIDNYFEMTIHSQIKLCQRVVNRINNSLVHLDLRQNNIQGADGGRQVTLLLQRFPALKVLNLYGNNLGPFGARELAPGFAAANHLEELDLGSCDLSNFALSNLLLDNGMINNSLTNLNLTYNNIGGEGEVGGREVSLLLQRFPKLKVLHLGYNRNLGDLDARALATGLAAASHLESLDLERCGLGNDGVANLVPDGQVNTSLTNLCLCENNIQGLVGGENVIALTARCTNLDGLDVEYHIFSPDQRHHLNLLLNQNRQNRLCREAAALGGSTFPVLFRFVEKAHCHEHGLSAIFLILQNDGDDYFCTALNREIE